MLPSSVESPLTGAQAVLVRRLPTQPLIAAYAKEYGYDAAACFEGLNEIGLYECPTTGVRFYHPSSVAGPESLYRQLETFEWNYQEKKWEHDVALKYISAGERVLDVGCGEGAFLARAATNGAIATGIELNKSAAAKAEAKGIEVRSEMLGEHALARPEYYDVVTNFQVLEHVTDPRGFIEDCLKALKPGGKLIIGVPNDGSFVGMDEDMVLNQPPHHMSLWKWESLDALSRLFPIDTRTIEEEPLGNLDWYQALMEKKYLQGTWQRRLYYRLGGAKLFRRFLVENAHTIAGHAILAVYDKRR